MKSSSFFIAMLALAGATGTAWWLQRPAPERAVNAAPALAPGSATASAAQAASTADGPVVESARVQRRTLADTVDAVGSLRARQGTVVRAEVGGRVTQINFRDSQRVTKGQLLVQLDDRLPQAQVRQAVAELSIAQNRHRRNSDLVKQGFISQQAVDESAAALQVAKAKAELARASADRLRVHAPFAGVTGLRNISVGDYLKEGDDIASLEDMSAMYVDFRLPERLQARVRPGQTARVQVDAFADRAFAAVVTAVDPLIDADGRSVVARGCIDNRLQHLRSGMFARVSARLGDDRAVLMVPESAVVSLGGRQTVVRLRQDQAAWTAERVVVETGAREAGRVEIVRPLAAGERIVTAGQQRIQRDGQRVRLMDGDSAAPAQVQAASDAEVVGANSAVQPTSADEVAAALPLADTAPGVNPCAALLAAARR
ncbi:efflux RND transporter periplasmic adaptor subunit [Ottowia sp.]|uniref:efflux RND transporter periplasmic adaptor subunit n=1 Tax=Ottowia sp. TaxID=1898956 RepID=UPI003A8BBC43